MTTLKKTIPILIAEDDKDQQLLISEAMQAGQLMNPLYFVNNGIELLDYLQRKGDYSDEEKYPMPGLILLDLNMPKMDGRAALKKIKEVPSFRQIPIIILTTSHVETDIAKTYEEGVSSYIVKPVNFSKLITVMEELKKYWFEIVELPPFEEH